MQAVVSGSALKNVWGDIATLFKKYDMAKVVSLEVEKQTLKLTADSGAICVGHIELRDVIDPISLTLTVLYTDITHFIRAKEDVIIELSEYYVSLRTNRVTLALRLGESLAVTYKPVGGRRVDLDFAVLRRAVSIFGLTTDLQKAYGRDFSISFCGDRAIMCATTMYIETKSQGLNCVLSLDQAKSIISFHPEYMLESSRMEFIKENGLLSMAVNLPVDVPTISQFESNMKPVCTLDMNGVVRDLIETKRAIGVAEAEIHLHENGFNLSLQRGGITVTEDYNTEGTHTFTFRYMFDLFVMCLSILGENKTIHIFAGEGRVCMKSPDTSILLRV